MDRAGLDETGPLENLFGAAEPMGLREKSRAPRFHQPQDVVRQIVEVRSGFFASQPATPYPDPQARTAAFDACFLDLAQACCLRKSEPQFQAILQWAFADPQRWLERSDLVAKLLWNLFQLADHYLLALQPINELLEKLERNQGKLGARALRVRRAIMARSWTEPELAQMIETEFQERADSRILADFVRIPEAMHQAIEAFARQHLKT